MPSPTHRFLCWAPPVLIAAPFVGVCTVAASFPESRPYFIKKFWVVAAWMYDFTHLFVVLAALLIVGSGWIWAILKTAPQRKYETLDEKIDDLRDSGRAHTHEQITGALNATEGADAASFTGTVGLHGLYVGNIIAAAGALESEHRLELAIRGFNGTGETIVVNEIAGHITARIGNHKDETDLQIPAIRRAIRVEPSAEFVLVLNQHLAPPDAAKFLDALENQYLTLRLDGLEIKAACVTNIDRSMSLPLWDAVSLRRRDDVVSDRVPNVRPESARMIQKISEPKVTFTPKNGPKEG